MNIPNKLQNLPENIRKLIFWSVVILVGSGLLFLWGKNFSKKIQNFQGEEFFKELKLPKVQEELKNLEIPKIGDEELKKIEEMMKQTGP